MAIITDPDSLNQGTEVVISTSAKTIQLLVAGNLTSSGVALQCLYSFLKEEWKNSSTLIKYAFPMTAITEEKFEFINGWDFSDDTSRQLVRTGGWAVRDLAGTIVEEYAGIITLGSLGVSDQVYYQQTSGGNPTNIILTGAVNQAVKVYGDSTHGNFDYRGYFKIFVRVYGKTYAMSQISDIGVSAMTYQVYRFPLANATDIKITDADAAMTGSPFSGMTITWHTTAQSRTIGTASYNFHIIVDGNNGTAEQIYEFVQFALRQTSDIDSGSGSQIGKVAEPLLKFTGDNLTTILTSVGGVYIDNFKTSDTNRLAFVDDSGASVTSPYVAALTLQFGDYLVADTSSIFSVFFTNDDAGDNAGKDFGTVNAIVVQDKNANPMSGSISGESEIDFSFDYDANVQRGNASAGTDAPITVVAIGLTTAQYVKATGTISRSTSNVVSLVAGQERNYKNE